MSISTDVARLHPSSVRQCAVIMFLLMLSTPLISQLRNTHKGSMCTVKETAAAAQLTDPTVYLMKNSLGDQFFVENRRFDQKMNIGGKVVPDYNNVLVVIDSEQEINWNRLSRSLLAHNGSRIQRFPAGTFLALCPRYDLESGRRAS